MEMNKTLVTIVDPQPLFRIGVKTLLQSSSQIEVKKQTDRFKHITDKETTQLLLIHADEFIKHRNDIISRYLQGASPVKVIVLTDKMEEAFIIDAIQAGIHGFLVKNMSGPNFLEAVEKVNKGMIYLDPSLSHVFLKHFKRSLENQARLEEVLPPLHLYTKRECEILQLLTDGRNNDTIAHMLGISEKTVKNHVSNLFKKMNVHSRTEAVVKAIKNNWVTLT